MKEYPEIPEGTTFISECNRIYKYRNIHRGVGMSGQEELQEAVFHPKRIHTCDAHVCLVCKEYFITTTPRGQIRRYLLVPIRCSGVFSDQDLEVRNSCSLRLPLEEQVNVVTTTTVEIHIDSFITNWSTGRGIASLTAHNSTSVGIRKELEWERFSFFPKGTSQRLT
jgi:hypothetical protein